MGTNSPELCLIKALFKAKAFKKYNIKLSLNYIKHNNKALYTIYQAVCLFHETFPEKDIACTADLEIFFLTLYPALSQREREFNEALFLGLDKANPDSELVESYIKALWERQEGHRIALLGLDIAEGRKSIKDAHIDLQTVLEASELKPPESPFISLSLKNNSVNKEKGLRWPLKSLNQMLGPLRKGDYGIVFARPETGKTTFVAHMATHFAQQTTEKNPILWFNNEQAGSVVLEYSYRSALGLTTQQLSDTLEESEKKYGQLIGTRLQIYDSALIYRADVDNICQQFSPSCIIFDQIDKLKGFDSDRDDLRLGAIYQWARELAKVHCPVIGVCQAGESGANKRWLTMEDIVNAKTSKQAEADWILGIGKLDQEGYEKVRHFHLCKNKLSGDKDSLPDLRHGKRDILISPEVAQYKEIL